MLPAGVTTRFESSVAAATRTALFEEPAEAPNSRKGRVRATLCRIASRVYCSAWSAGFRPLRVLRLTDPLLRPAPPKGRAARRVEWRMTLPGGPTHVGRVENPPRIGRGRSLDGVAG
jgi:hypothetical protein